MIVVVAAVATSVLAACASRPRHGCAPLRLAVMRSAIVVGASAVAAVEVMSFFGVLNATSVLVFWCAALVASGFAAWRRWDKPAIADRVRGIWDRLGRLERAGAVVLMVLVAGEFAVSLLAVPNSTDSLTYHLPKIERWVAQGSVANFPTEIYRQVTLAPGAEYLLTHLRLVSGSDGLYNLLEWGAGIGCLVVATRICAQLGGGARAQLVTALVFGATPIVVLEATSTQTDLVVAVWVGCVASLVLDGLRGRGGVVFLGLATGLVAVTKVTGLLAVGPLLVWWGCWRLWRGWRDRGRRVRRLAETAAATGVILALAALVVGPFLGRTVAAFGHPLGPDLLRETHAMQEQDPASVTVNVLRVGHTLFETPTPLTTVTAEAVIAAADLLGVDPQDRDTTFEGEQFPHGKAWHPNDSKGSYPVTAALVLIAVAMCVIRPGRLKAPVWIIRSYVAVIGMIVLLYCANVRWQPWGNRLLIFALLLAVPLVGLWLETLRRRQLRGAVAVVFVIALLGPVVLLGGHPRPLVGPGSILTNDELDTRLFWTQQHRDGFERAAQAVTDAGAQRVGIVQGFDDPEYIWWLLLPGKDLRPMTSAFSRYPADSPSDVDAIVCYRQADACERVVPDDWKLEFHDDIGYALPR